MPFDLSSARPVGDVYPADVQRDRDRKRLDILQDEQRRYTDPASQKALKTEVADTKKKIGPTKFDLASAKPVGDGSAPAKPGAGKPAAKAEPPEDPTSFWNLAGAATEPMLAMGSGALGSITGGILGLGQLAANKLGGEKGPDPGDVVRRVQNAMTYQPRTTGAKNAMKVFGFLPEKLHEGAEWAGRKTQDVTGSPLAATAVQTGAEFLPNLIGAKGAKLFAEKTPGVIPPLPRPKLEPEATLLKEKGVQPALGQMLGGGWNTTEQALAKWPLVGAPIRGARNRARVEFNEAPIKDALAEIGEKPTGGVKPGHDMIADAYEKFQQAYADVQARGKIRLGPKPPEGMPGTPAVPGQIPPPGPSLRADIDNVIAMAKSSKMPKKYADELERIINAEVLDRFPGLPKPKARTAADIAGSRPGATPSGREQVVGGETIKTMQSNLRREINLKKNNENRDVRDQAQALKEVQAAINRALERENPQLAAEMKAVDRGYAKYKIVERAAGKSKDGFFTPAQFLQAIKDKDKSKDKHLSSIGKAPMQDFGKAAQKIIGDTLPDSGTPTQALVAALVSSGLGKKGMGILGIPGGLAGMAGLSPIYSPAGLSLPERMLLRPPGRRGRAAGVAAGAIPFGMIPPPDK